MLFWNNAGLNLMISFISNSFIINFFKMKNEPKLMSTKCFV